MVKYIGIRYMQALLAQRSVERIIAGLADYIDADYQRWPVFEKTIRLASHSAQGVIELMPISDGNLYAFKYVNGHPSNPGRRLADGHGIRRAGRRGERISATVERTHHQHRLAHRRDLIAGSAQHGACRQPGHGADWQRRAK